MLRILVVGLLVLVVAMLLMPRNRIAVPAPEVATVLPSPRELPAVMLTDAAGDPLTLADLSGEYTLLFFGFTNCPDVCPLTLQVLAGVRAALEARAPALVPQVVFISVDPLRDTPERIGQYLRNFHSDFIGATAPDDVLAPLLETLSVMVHKTEQDGVNYNVVHNGTIYVLDQDARWIGLFGGSSHDADTVATDYIRIRRGGAGLAQR
jgi:protein SCO1/2